MSTVMTKWVREGDFNLGPVSYNSLVINSIKEVYLRREGRQVYLGFILFNPEEIINDFKKFFPTSRGNNVEVNFNKLTWKCFLDFAKYYNQKYNQEIFDKSIKQELENILSSIENRKHCKHELSEYQNAFSVQANPMLINSTRMSKYLHDLTMFSEAFKKNAMTPLQKKNCFKTFTKFLTDGENIYQHYALDTPPRMIIMYKFNIDYLKLLVFYGLNPFQRIKSVYLFPSAYEDAIKYKNVEALDFITSLVTVAKKSPPKIQALAHQIINFKNSNFIVTKIKFNNDDYLFSTMKSVTHLSSEERAIVFGLFKSTFEDGGDETSIRKLFEKEFSGDAIIGLIYHQKRIIGLNLWKITARLDAMVLYCMYAIMKPGAFSNTGIMTILSSAPGFALQMLFPDKRIDVFYCAASHYSFRQAEGAVYSPKYQTPEMDRYIAFLLRQFFNRTIQIKHDGIMYYIEDEARVKQILLGQRSDLLYQIFNRMLAWETKSLVELMRSVPVLFPLGKERMQVMHEIAEKIGINFASMCHDLALNTGDFYGRILKMKSVKNPDIKSIYNKNCNTLFFVGNPLETHTNNDKEFCSTKISNL